MAAIISPARTRLAACLALACGTLLLLPQLAEAATTIGQTFAPTTSCGPPFIAIQTATGSTPPAYAVPAGGGVITQWSTQADAAAGQDEKLKVFRAGSGASFTVVGESVDQPLTASGLNSFPVRIPVQAGDVLGFFRNGPGDCGASTSDPADVIKGQQTNAPDPALGTGYTPPATGTSERIDVAAVVEPDADGDGFGDETQDQCPTDPTMQAACQADLSVTKSADRATATVGDHVTSTIAVRNNSAFNTSKAVGLADILPGNVTLVSASTTQGTCTGTNCALGDLAKGATATVTIVARATASGPATDTATVSSQTPDPNATNNSAAMTTNVIPTFAITLAGQTISIGSGGVGTLKVACSAAAQGPCIGTVVVKSASKILLREARKSKKKIQILGRGRFASIAPGKTAKVKFKLTSKAMKLLLANGTLKAVATITAHDSRRVSNSSSAKLSLKPQKKPKRH